MMTSSSKGIVHIPKECKQGIETHPDLYQKNLLESAVLDNWVVMS